LSDRTKVLGFEFMCYYSCLLHHY